jgi:hypothetical protein
MAVGETQSQPDPKLVPRLGDTAQEIVSNFKGVVIAITHHLGGRVTVTLEPLSLQGDPRPRTFDIERVFVRKQGHCLPPRLATGSGS